MSLPAAALAVLGLAVGLAPHLRHAATAAAREMADRTGYQARVLDNATLPVNVPEPRPLERSGAVRALVTTAVAFALAAWSLSRHRPQKKSALWRVLRSGVQGLRQLHSGHVGDYVAFLAFGAAAFGVVLAILIVRLGL